MFVIYRTATPNLGMIDGWVVSPPGAPAPTAPTDFAAGAVTEAELAEITDLIEAGYAFGVPAEPYKAYFEAFYFPANAVGSRVGTAEYGGGVPPVAADEAVTVRLERNRRLAATDFTQIADVPISTGLRADFATYRQALRDVPQQAGFPLSITWPTAPAYVKT
jgi:hypothetical protein